MFIAALFLTAPNWKQLEWPLTSEEIEPYLCSGIGLGNKKKQTNMRHYNREITKMTLNKRSQRKSTYWMIPFI